MPLIVEGIVTTLNDDGTVNIAPMGPIVHGTDQLEFRPFQTSRTFHNLKQHRCGIFHVIDDVLVLAETALNLNVYKVSLTGMKDSPLQRLADCCQWSEFEITSIDESQPRSQMIAQIVQTQTVRQPIGWNRARHAILELVIMCTRLHLLHNDEIQAERNRTQVIVEKTGSQYEKQTLSHIEQFLACMQQDEGVIDAE